MSILGVDRVGIRMREAALSPDQAAAFGKALCLRCAGTPTQHVTGTAPFRHLVLQARPGALIPRPETEVVVDVVLDRLRHAGPAPVVVDIGTGSGAIALSVAQEHSGAQVYATDCSLDALEVARTNIHALAFPVTVLEGDLYGALPEGLRESVDVIVSNPPYLTEDEYAQVSREVRADPRDALVGGTTVHARLTSEGRTWLRSGGSLVVEIGMTQAVAVVKLFEQAGFRDVIVTKDLAGRDRVVAGIAP